MNIIARSYIESGWRPAKHSVRLPDDEYSRGLDCFVPACADAVPVNFQQKIIYLAQRATKPMLGWWWIGGRMSPNESPSEAIVRNFKRETGIELLQDRFSLATVFDYRWKDRAQAPQENGCHVFGLTFTVELSSAELSFAAMHLDAKEYTSGAGLTPFTRQELVEANVFPAIIDLYDHLFPMPSKQAG